MAQLFAAYLAQKMAPALASGAYDPEQELWIGNNQLQGATRTNVETHTSKSTVLMTLALGTVDLDTAADSDTHFDSDNP